MPMTGRVPVGVSALAMSEVKENVRLLFLSPSRCRFAAILARSYGMFFSPPVEQGAKSKSIYYGWIIVIVGFLAHIASAFSISSTLRRCK